MVDPGIMIDQAMSFFLENPLGWVTIGLVFILFYMYNKQKKPEKFKSIEIEKLTKKDFKETLKANGKKDGRLLRKGFIKLGRIGRIAEINEKHEKGNQKFHLIKVYPFDPIKKILAVLFDFYTDMLYIKSENLRFHEHQVFLEDNVRLTPFAGVYTDSDIGISEVRNIGWKQFQKDTIEELANLPKRTVFLDMSAVSRKATLLEEATRLEREKWRTHIDELVGKD